MVARTGPRREKSAPTRFKPRRTVDDVKKRAERTGGRFDSPFKQEFDTFRPRAGDNVIRILPPSWEGDHEHFGQTIWVHSYVGSENSTYACPQKMLGKRCPICEAAKEAQSQGDAEEAKLLKAQEKIVYWVIDRESDNPEKPLIWLVSWTMDRDIASRTIDKKRNDLIFVEDPSNGYDLMFSRLGQGIKTRYNGIAFDREPSPIADDDKTQDEIRDFLEANPLDKVLHFYDADYLEGIISGTSGTKDDLDKDEDDDKPSRRRGRDTEDEDEDERPTRKARGKIDEDAVRGKKYDPDDDRPSRRRREPEPEEEDEEEETTTRHSRTRDTEEERPRSRRSGDTTTEDRGSRRSRRDEPEDEEEDEDEDERPSRSGTRGTTKSRGTHDEEEDERPRRSSRREEPEDEEEDEDERPSRQRIKRR